ncbi:MAG: DEAD/DEAH box helicase [Rhodocyclaceae bacterium]|nr:DEAD/DEAH box helicase [Rhodocyclaceae bacterium]
MHFIARLPRLSRHPRADDENPFPPKKDFVQSHDPCVLPINAPAVDLKPLPSAARRPHPARLDWCHSARVTGCRWSQNLQTDISFASLGLAEPLLRAIADTGYTHPTPIQVQAIPMVIDGGDLLAAAQTGTGKTAGFTLPLLHRLAATPLDAPAAGRPRCLILAPTRELAAQVEESVQTYGKHLPLTSMVMFGGVSINPQIERLAEPVDVLVATPGRLLDHVGQKTIDLSGIEILVLDEADRMLDMGFIRDIRKILALLPEKRQNLLFSATFSDEIRDLANGLLHDPGCVEVARRNTASELVDQAVYPIGQKQKRELLAHLIRGNQWFQVLVFTRTKHGANKLAEYLCKHEVPALAIHGNKSQSARTRALAQFKDSELQVLVATDIAARGLDIDQLPHVVNFDMPNVPEDYVHRIGRTGRAGSEGEAISLVDPEEEKLLSAIERLINRQIERRDMPADFVPSAEGADPASEPRPPRQPRQPREKADGKATRESKPPREGKPQKESKPPRERGPEKGNGNGNRADAGGGRNARKRGSKGRQTEGGQPIDPRANYGAGGNSLPPGLMMLDDEEIEEVNFNRMDIDPTGRRVRQRPEVDGNRAMPAGKSGGGGNGGGGNGNGNPGNGGPGGGGKRRRRGATGRNRGAEDGGSPRGNAAQPDRGGSAPSGEGRRKRSRRGGSRQGGEPSGNAG